MDHVIREISEVLQTGGGWAVSVVLAWWIVRKDIQTAKREREYQETYITMLRNGMVSLERFRKVLMKCEGVEGK